MCQPARDHGTPPPTGDPECDQRQPDYAQRDQQRSPRTTSARSHDRRRGRSRRVDDANGGTSLMSPAPVRPGRASAGVARKHALCLRGRPASTMRHRVAGPRRRRRARARGLSMRVLSNRHGSMRRVRAHDGRVARGPGDAFGNRLRRRHRGSRGLGGRRRLSRRLGRRRRLRRRPRRQERQRIDVPVRVGRPADAQVHVGLRSFGLTARADRPDDIALAHCCPDRHADRAEVDERDRPAVLGADRQA
jgi:hypothetical protein